MARRNLDDVFLAALSTQYREHVAARRPGGLLIAEAYHVPASTAHRWIAVARQRGFLSPANGTGERPLRRPHGIGAYIDRKCRCATCRAAYREYRRDERQKMSDTASRGAAEFEHGAHGYTNWGCRCEMCSAAERVRRRASAAANQAQTLQRATRRGQQWTGPELELVARTDLTMKQAALALGRTYAAVRAMRLKVKADPKTIHLAGLPQRPA